MLASHFGVLTRSLALYKTSPYFTFCWCISLTLIKEAEIKIDFECIYPLDDQVIDENYTVTGEKILTTRRHVGALYFTIEPTADVFIGERATFTIVPASAGLVNFRAKYCRIAKGKW